MTAPAKKTAATKSASRADNLFDILSSVADMGLDQIVIRSISSSVTYDSGWREVSTPVNSDRCQITGGSQVRNDSLVEGDGFELLVPRHGSPGISAHRR